MYANPLLSLSHTSIPTPPSPRGTCRADYGDAALELFHVLSLRDIKQVEYLEECARELDPRLWVDRSSLVGANMTHGGSNVTYLTGLFQVRRFCRLIKSNQSRMHYAYNAKACVFSCACIHLTHLHLHLHHLYLHLCCTHRACCTSYTRKSSTVPARPWPAATQ